MMQSKTLLTAALAVAGASAQAMMNLTALLSSTSELSSLNTLLGQYPTIAKSLASATNVTLLAPNNAAIKALTQSAGAAALGQESIVQAILDYHVIPGKIYASAVTATPAFLPTLLNTTTYTNVTGGQVAECQLEGSTVVVTSGMKMMSNVTTANVNFTGGVAHIVDSVLTIPSNVSTTAVAANLTSLVGAVIATNLTTTLDMASDITIFAPSNDAFQSIASGLGALTTTQLTDILSYHVISGTVAYSSTLGNMSVPTLAGGKVKITVEDGAVFVNSARVINPDILVAGGVMHVIDSVLNPNDTNVKPSPAAKSPAVAYSGASSLAKVPLTSGVPTPMSTNAALAGTTTNVAQGYATAAAGSAAGGSGGKSSSSSSAAAAVPTGMIEAAALFGGAALVANW